VTVRIEIERVVQAALFPAGPPAPGDAFASVSGTTAYVVTKVRRMVGATSKARGPELRTFGHRVRVADLPAGTIPAPWPKAVTAPSRAAEAPPFIGPPVAPPAILTAATRQLAQRKHVLALKRAAGLDATGAVPQHQIAHGQGHVGIVAGSGRPW